MIFKLVVAIIGAAGILLAGHLAPSTAQHHTRPAVAGQVQFGGVSAQTATAAGTVDRGAAFYTVRGGGLHRELSSR